jgi:ATP phosphoribosyltransferase regulatory subunit
MDCPATGFSMGINMIMTALEKQNKTAPAISSDIYMCYAPSMRKTAFEACRKLRNGGLSIEMDVSGMDLPEAKKYASCNNINGLVFIGGTDDIRICDLEKGETVFADMERLLSVDMEGLLSGKAGGRV